jgi:hypothetical protein
MHAPERYSFQITCRLYRLGYDESEPFCNFAFGTFQTSRHVRYSAAIGGISGHRAHAVDIGPLLAAGWTTQNNLESSNL